MKIKTYVLLLLGVLFINNFNAKMVEFVEDAYLLPASGEIAKTVQDVIDQHSFDMDYEVIVPKKAGMQINPWNKYIASGRNPSTGNVVFIINPAWFSKLSQDEQKFLIVRAFFIAQSSQPSMPVKIASWILIVMSFLIIALLTVLLGKISVLSRLKLWMRILLAMLLMAIGNVLILNKVQLKILEYLAFRQTMYITHAAIKTSGVTKDVAIDALRKFDTVVKDGLKDGEVFWKTFEKNFEKQVQTLKNS